LLDGERVWFTGPGAEAGGPSLLIGLATKSQIHNLKKENIKVVACGSITVTSAKASIHVSDISIPQ
jgi:hypothetical protein